MCPDSIGRGSGASPMNLRHTSPCESVHVSPYTPNPKWSTSPCQSVQVSLWVGELRQVCPCVRGLFLRTCLHPTKTKQLCATCLDQETSLPCAQTRYSKQRKREAWRETQESKRAREQKREKEGGETSRTNAHRQADNDSRPSFLAPPQVSSHPLAPTRLHTQPVASRAVCHNEHKRAGMRLSRNTCARSANAASGGIRSQKLPGVTKHCASHVQSTHDLICRHPLGGFGGRLDIKPCGEPSRKASVENVYLCAYFPSSFIHQSVDCSDAEFLRVTEHVYRRSMNVRTKIGRVIGIHPIPWRVQRVETWSTRAAH
jgi:hypothetical protein